MRKPVVRYVVRRTFFALATFLFFVIVIFTLPRAVPGNPVAVLIGTLAAQGDTNPELITAVHMRFMEEFGLGLPVWEQFTRFVERTVRGDLGTSISMFPRRVSDIIAGFLPWTLALLLPATITSWILGNYLGAVVAYKRKTLVDSVVTPVFLFISQTPFYWFAMVVLFAFAVHLELFPIGGTHSWGMRPALTWSFIADYLYHYALPFLTLVVVSVGTWAIGMRSMMIYELGSDYIHFGDALGLPERKLRAYAFRSAMLPQITGLALSFGLMLGGSLLLELVFNYRGMGSILFTALTTLDYPLIQGIFITLSSVVILANLTVDLAYAIIDPRIRVGYSGSGGE